MKMSNKEKPKYKIEAKSGKGKTAKKLRNSETVKEWKIDEIPMSTKTKGSGSGFLYTSISGRKKFQNEILELLKTLPADKKEKVQGVVVWEHNPGMGGYIQYTAFYLEEEDKRKLLDRDRNKSITDGLLWK